MREREKVTKSKATTKHSKFEYACPFVVSISCWETADVANFLPISLLSAAK